MPLWVSPMLQHLMTLSYETRLWLTFVTKGNFKLWTLFFFETKELPVTANCARERLSFKMLFLFIEIIMYKQHYLLSIHVICY